MAEHLAAGLHDAAVGQRHGLDAAPGALARLEHDHVGAGTIEVARRRQPREPGPEHCHVDHVQLSS